MDDLIARQLMAETSPDEASQLRDWRRASEENEARYRARARVWELLGKLPTRVSREAPDAGELIARASVRRLPTAPARGERRSRRRPRRDALRVRIAALSTLAAAGIVAIALILSRPATEVTFGAAEFITGPHEVTTVRLDDGTVVRLAPGSRLEFEGRSKRVRQLSFEGVGYFAVARDPARPFVIRTEAGEARVLGTRFEFQAEDKDMRVIVVEGRVALQAAGERKEISSGQMGRAGADSPPIVVDVEDTNEFLGWVDGLFAFQATPLNRVVRELGDYYGFEIEIEDTALASREVTAWLREQSFDAALTAVCGAVGAECTIGADGATMRLPDPTR